MKPAMKSFACLSGTLRAAGVAGLMWLSVSAYAGEAQACPATLQHTFDRLQDEKPQSLCQYSGKVVLIVNTASYCGFTGQYKGCLLYTSPSPRDKRQSRMPSSA